MKIALLGYGRMGKEIEKIAIYRKHSIELVIDIDNSKDLTIENLRKTDIAIDFSIPDTAYDNIMKCFEADIPIVCGTTGWLDKFNKVTSYCRKNNKSFFYSSNYSIGVNIFFAINKKLAELMNRVPDYAVELEEIHHIHKLDAPSGTAITIANDIIEKLDRKTSWELGTSTDSKAIKIRAIREGEVPGIHIVKYDSPVDEISIRHSAKNRKGLALGAILAAEFLFKKTGIYSMDDLMNAV
jgi:4-hydroxy-tetrahydrodipicolinate reductase